MCGILAVISKENQSLNKESCLKAKEELLKRGPDFSYFKFYKDDRVFLAQTILSITGSPAGDLDNFHMTSDGRFDVIFNGEIYNHQDLASQYLDQSTLTTKTDTEVLTRLHETLDPTQLINHLDGMFSFISYDSHKEEVLISRDVIGEKILYYLETEQFLVVSSEIKPILVFCPDVKLNLDSLKEYFFTRHYLTLDQTPFEGVRLFPSGTTKSYSLKDCQFKTLNRVQLKDLVNRDKVEVNRERTLEQITDEFEEIFDRSCRTMVPHDVPYSAVFSGGIDSSLCSYYMAKYREPEHFVTLVFPGKDIISEEIGKFEAFLPRKITKLQVDTDSFSEAFDICYDYNSSPIATHSFVSQYLLSKLVKEAGCKVIVGGDGADELFGGYELYKKVFDIAYESMPKLNPSPYSGFVPLGFEFQNWSADKLKQNLQDKWEELSSVYDFVDDIQERVFQTMLLSDTSVELESVGIRSSDMMSMINSVEGRSPFMRREVLEFAVNLPAKFKIDPSYNGLLSTKKVVKNLFKRVFGEELLYPKQGFSGYPNEAAAKHIKNDYQLFNSSMKPVRDIVEFAPEQRALEWKVMNIEFFLRKYRSYL